MLRVRGPSQTGLCHTGRRWRPQMKTASRRRYEGNKRIYSRMRNGKKYFRRFLTAGFRGRSTLASQSASDHNLEEEVLYCFVLFRHAGNGIVIARNNFGWFAEPSVGGPLGID